MPAGGGTVAGNARALAQVKAPKPTGQSRRVPAPAADPFGARPGAKLIPGKTIAKPKPVRREIQPTFAGTGAESTMRQLPPPVKGAMRRAVVHNGKIYASNPADQHALNQYQRDIVSAQNDVHARLKAERVRKRTLSAGGLGKYAYRDPLGPNTLEQGGVTGTNDLVDLALAVAPGGLEAKAGLKGALKLGRIIANVGTEGQKARFLEGLGSRALAMRGANAEFKKAMGDLSARSIAGSALRAPLIPLKHPIRTAAVSPLLAEGLAPTQGRTPSIRAALEGHGTLASLTGLKAGGTGIGSTVGNALVDAVNLPAQMIPSVYIPIVAGVAALHGDTQRWHDLIKTLKETDPAGALILGGDPAKAIRNAQQHPLFAALEAAGGYGAAGRGAGGLLRGTVPLKHLPGVQFKGLLGERGRALAATEGRAPLTINEGRVVKERPYSPNVITKQVQKWSDQRPGVTLPSRPRFLKGLEAHLPTKAGQLARMTKTDIAKRVRTSQNVIFRYKDDIGNSAKHFDAGDSTEAVTLTAMNGLRVIPNRPDVFLSDAHERLSDFQHVRAKVPDGSWEAANIDANIRALQRVLTIPGEADKVKAAAIAFKQAQTPGEIALFEQEAIPVLQALRRSEMPWALFYGGYRHAGENVGLRHIVVPPDEGGPLGGAPATPTPGGPRPGGPAPVVPPEPGPFEGIRANRGPGGERSAIPSIKDRVENAFQGPLLGAESVDPLRTAGEAASGVVRPESPLMHGTDIGADRFLGNMEWARGEKIVSNEGGLITPGEILRPGDPRLDIYNKLFPQHWAAEWAKIDPRGEIARLYGMDTTDPLKGKRPDPQTLDDNYMALAGKTDKEIQDMIDKQLGDTGGGDAGGGTGLMDRNEEQNLSDALRAADEALQRSNDLRTADPAVVRGIPEEHTAVTDAIRNYEEGNGSIDEINNATDALNEHIKWATPMSKDEIAQQLSEIDQLLEAYNRMEPKPTLNQAEQSRPITEAEFLEHYESRKNLPVGEGHMGKSDPSAVDMNSLRHYASYLTRIPDPSRIRDRMLILAKFAEHNNWNWATFRIAQSMANYYDWVPGKGKRSETQYVADETGRPPVGVNDETHLKNLVDELNQEIQTTDPLGGNPSRVGHLTREIASIKAEPNVTLREIRGLPETERNVLEQHAKDTLAEAKTTLENHRDEALKDPYSMEGQAWRALNNDVLRADRRLADGTIGHDDIAAMTNHMENLHTNLITAREVGGGIRGPEAHMDGGIDISKMTDSELQQERLDLVEALRAAQANGDTKETLRYQRDLGAVEDQMAHNENVGFTPSPEMEQAARDAAGQGPEIPSEPPQEPPKPPGGPPAPPGGSEPGVPPMGWQPPEEVGVPTSELVRQRESTGLPRPAFISARISRKAGPGAGRPFASGAIHGQPFTGETVKQGLQPGDIQTLFQAALTPRVRAERIKLHRELLDGYGIRGKDGKPITVSSPEELARLRTKLGLDPNKEYDILPEAPAQLLDPGTLSQLKEAMLRGNATPERMGAWLQKWYGDGDPMAHDLSTFLELDDLNKQLNASSGGGRFSVVEKPVADAYHAQLQSQLVGSLGKAMRLWAGAFKSAVLPTSTKWLGGNLFDVTMRALIAGIAPPGLVHLDPRFYLMKELKKVMFEIDPERAADWFASMSLRSHYGAASATHRITGREGETFKGNVKRLIKSISTAHDRPGTLRALADIYGHYRDTVYHFNGKFIEETPQFAFLGKQAQKELRTRLAHWDGSHAAYQAALEDLGRGWLHTPKQEFLAERLTRQFGDWSTVGPSERKFMANYAPFYMWARASSKFVLVTLPRDHPIFTALASVANSMTQDERRLYGFDLFYNKAKGVLPKFLQGGLPEGAPTSKYSIKPLSYSTSFGVFADYPQSIANFILPQGQSALWAASGLDFTGSRIVDGDGTPAGIEQRAGLMAYFLVEPIIPFAAMGRTLLRADRQQKGWFPLVGFKGPRSGHGPFKVLPTKKTLGHALIPAPIPGSKGYDKQLTDYLRWLQSDAQFIAVPIKGGKQAPGRGSTTGVGIGSQGVGGSSGGVTGVGGNAKGVGGK